MRKSKWSNVLANIPVRILIKGVVAIVCLGGGIYCLTMMDKIVNTYFDTQDESRRQTGSMLGIPAEVQQQRKDPLRIEEISLVQEISPSMKLNECDWESIPPTSFFIHLNRGIPKDFFKEYDISVNSKPEIRGKWNNIPNNTYDIQWEILDQIKPKVQYKLNFSIQKKSQSDGKSEHKIDLYYKEFRWCNVFLEEYKKGKVKAALAFNFPVDTGQLYKHLTFKIGHKKLPVVWKGKKITIRPIAEFAVENAQMHGNITLEIKKTLTPSSAKIYLSQPVKTTLSLVPALVKSEPKNTRIPKQLLKAKYFDSKQCRIKEGFDDSYSPTKCYYDGKEFKGNNHSEADYHGRKYLCDQQIPYHKDYFICL